MDNQDLNQGFPAQGSSNQNQDPVSLNKDNDTQQSANQSFQGAQSFGTNQSFDNNSFNNNNNFGGYQDYTTAYSGNGNYQNTSMNDGNESNGFSVASLVFGILSLVCCCIPVIDIIFAVLAIFFFAKAHKRNEQSGMATAGLVCGIIGTVLGLIGTYFIGRLLIITLGVLHKIKQAGLWEQYLQMDQSQKQELIQEFMYQK